MVPPDRSLGVRPPETTKAESWSSFLQPRAALFFYDSNSGCGRSSQRVALRGDWKKDAQNEAGQVCIAGEPPSGRPPSLPARPSKIKARPEGISRDGEVRHRWPPHLNLVRKRGRRRSDQIKSLVPAVRRRLGIGLMCATPSRPRAVDCLVMLARGYRGKRIGDGRSRRRPAARCTPGKS